MNNNPEADGLGYVSIPALLQYIESAERYGLARWEMLVAAGLNKDVLENKAQRISGSALQEMLRFIIPKSGDPLFGLHTAQTIAPSSYSVLGYIAMNAANIGEAMGKIQQYEKLVGDMGLSSIIQRDDKTELHWHCRFKDPLVKTHLIDNVLASWVTYTRWLCDSAQAPHAVMIEHPAPKSDKLIQAYQQLFGCTIHFNQRYSALIVTREILELPLKHADKLLLKTLEQHASQQLSELDDDLSFSERVRHSMAFLLPTGVPRKEKIAQYLNVSERTLQRRLHEEGSSYQQILDKLRCTLAQQYLHNPAISTEDICQQLGFQELRSYHRFFKKMFAMTPGQYKKHHKL